MYQPDQPPSVGAMVRLCACFDLPLALIEPCGFPLSDQALRRVAMDYLRLADIHRHASWLDFQATRPPGRLVLLTTKGSVPHTEFQFAPEDTLLLGRESAGVPPEVHAAVDARILVPLAPGRRSLNIIVAAAMVLGEALRQTHSFHRPGALQEER